MSRIVTDSEDRNSGYSPPGTLLLEGESKEPDLQIKRSRTNPFAEETYLHETFSNVLDEERDMIIVVDDYDGRRGTGKTVTSLQLAAAMDQTEEGMTQEKATLEPEELEIAYTQQPQQSALVLDESEVGASNRQAMSKTNQALREIMSMGRVEQKYTIVNTPIKGFIDSDILKLADCWISMLRRGYGLVHDLQWNSYMEKTLTPTKQTLEIDDIKKGTDLREIYNNLTRDKRAHMRGEGGSGYIPRSDHEEILEKKLRERERKTRNELIRSIMKHSEIQETAISQRMIGEATGISQSQVSDILSE